MAGLSREDGENATFRRFAGFTPNRLHGGPHDWIDFRSEWLMRIIYGSKPAAIPCKARRE